jgi:hypothetical protein
MAYDVGQEVLFWHIGGGTGGLSAIGVTRGLPVNAGGLFVCRKRTLAEVRTKRTIRPVGSNSKLTF